jgi:hypothetical protein
VDDRNPVAIAGLIRGTVPFPTLIFERYRAEHARISAVNQNLLFLIHGFVMLAVLSDRAYRLAGRLFPVTVWWSIVARSFTRCGRPLPPRWGRRAVNNVHQVAKDSDKTLVRRQQKGQTHPRKVGDIGIAGSFRPTSDAVLLSGFRC